MDWLVLQKDEKIVAQYRPEAVPWIFIPFIGMLFLSAVLTFMSAIFVAIIGLIGVVLVFVVTFGLQLVARILSYNHAYYIITNKRLVQKSGLIGYSVKSVSFNRLADVIVRHSLMEKIFSVGSLMIQTLAGQISTGRFGAEISFMYIKNPEEAQKLVYKMIGK